MPRLKSGAAGFPAAPGRVRSYPLSALNMVVPLCPLIATVGNSRPHTGHAAHTTEDFRPPIPSLQHFALPRFIGRSGPTGAGRKPLPFPQHRLNTRVVSLSETKDLRLI